MTLSGDLANNSNRHRLLKLLSITITVPCICKIIIMVKGLQTGVKKLSMLLDKILGLHRCKCDIENFIYTHTYTCIK